MDGLSFLNLVWPSTGPYLLSIPTTWQGKDDAGAPVERHGHRQYVFDTAQAAYDAALYASDDEEADVYYAMGALKSVQRDDRGKLVGPRKATNIREIRTFWLDIDVKEDPAAYPTQRAAFEALRAFVKQTGMPHPYVVSSGAGLHVYWPMVDAIEGDKWGHYASLFKQITEVAGLKADPSRTADRTSILRPPDTVNRKPGRPATRVEVKVVGVVTPTEALLKRIAFLASARNINATPQRTYSNITVNPAAAANNELANTHAPAPVGKVMKRCPHLLWQFTHPKEVTQGMWYAALGVLLHCISGEKACHTLSQRDPGRYDAAAVNTKVAQIKNGGYGPTTCVKFEREGSTQCATCKWKGKVTSPIVLATMADEAVAPKMTLLVRGQAVEEELPDPPFPYKRVIAPGATHAKVVIELVEQEDGVETTADEVIYDYDIYPHTIFFDEASGGFHARVKHWLPKEGWRDLLLPFGDMYDGRKLSSMFGHIGVMISGRKKMEHLEGYMRAYIAELQKKISAQVVYSQLGWKPDEGVFVAPGLVISDTDIVPCEVSSNVNHACNKWRAPQGDLEVWKDIAAAYDPPECVSLQFTVATGFASVLMSMTNYRGAIVAAVGERGCGKTTASWLANSIFNHKNMGDITDRDTGNALYAKLGALHNLLGTYDEATKLDGNTLSSLAYAINQGQGKNRLDRNAQFKENVGDWALMLLMTTNRSPHAILGASSSDSSAESARIFQYTVPPRTLTKAFADACFDRLNDHFGLAGPLFIKEVLQDRPAVAERIKHWIREIDRLADVSSGERFWSAVPACVLTAVEICQRVGILSYDIQGLVDFSVSSIHIMRTNVSDNIGTPIGTLSDYFNANLRNTLIVGAIPGGLGNIMRHAPTGELRIRIDDSAGRAYVDCSHIRMFCMDKGVDIVELKNELINMGVVVNPDRKIMLGRGTSFKSVQTRCLEIDMTHVAMTGLADFVKDVAVGNNVSQIAAARRS